jgi:hypothetical protein
MPQGEVVIDPFTGQSMSREALDALLVPYRRRQGARGIAVVAAARALPAGGVAARDHRARPEEPQGDPSQRRRLATVARGDAAARHPAADGVGGAARSRPRGRAPRRGDAAAADLSAYLEHVPHAGDRSAIEERLLELGHGDRKRLH